MQAAREAEVELAELGRIITGRTPPSAKDGYFGNTIPFITPSDMVGQKYIRVTERYLSTEGRALLHRCVVPAGSITVSCIGWQMGKVAMIDRDSVTNQQLNTIVPNSKVDAHFLYYSLSGRREELKRLGSVGTRTPIVNKSVFSRLKIKLPSRPEQRRIAGILSAYDDLIENCERRIRVLDEMARALYREWFVKFRYPGHEGVPFVESAIGRIPKGWQAQRCGDIAIETRRCVPKGALKSSTRYVGLEHIPRRSLALKAWEEAVDLGSNKLSFKKGNILFGKIRPHSCPRTES